MPDTVPNYRSSRLKTIRRITAPHESSSTLSAVAQSLPVVRPLPVDLTAEEVYRRLVSRPHCLFLDSSLRHQTLGRYSFVTADPFEMLRGRREPQSWVRLQQLLQRYAWPTCPILPPFQGGAAGLLTYELGGIFECLPTAEYDEFRLPDLAIGLYDVVIAFDHHRDRGWIVSQGFPELEPSRRLRRAKDRAELFQDWLADAPSRPSVFTVAEPIPIRCTQHAARAKGVTSNFSEAGYLRAVQRAIDYIWAGDVFQVNLSQRLLYPARESTADLYLRLRRRTPAPFAGYFDLGDCQIASASPERFVAVRDGQIETRPIKGTRRTLRQPEADLFAGDELLASDKDRSENVMIVDLLRNDLSRVCSPNSVRVLQLCGLETYGYVQHLVSSVVGQLSEDQNATDLLEASFPGGSITGAPKIRAMEVINELEQTARGAYCGSLGYLGFDGQADLSILIRTVTAGGGWWQFPVGGGVVAQSDPRQEYEETWHKAAGILGALGE